jgi:hypothetical protein
LVLRMVSSFTVGLRCVWRDYFTAQSRLQYEMRIGTILSAKKDLTHRSIALFCPNRALFRPVTSCYQMTGFWKIPLRDSDFA